MISFGDITALGTFNMDVNMFGVNGHFKDALYVQSQPKFKSVQNFNTSRFDESLKKLTIKICQVKKFILHNHDIKN